ncbi:DUF1573 domain-containing protein [Clostridium botulinum]|uniref:DUF1573 domain-containing protein n=2 Tax=Clostridium botulinum TaxID=1491 RepID=A0A9Q1ZBF0_CLOBO|nr:hypothetical protein [Clostridium botulinum]AEB74883.1 conserved hypothetical protein [Clostridium botulinum BKT015925]KEI03394.1 hypothetical protein Y848_04910 [Clostridium botulinum C/D str. Sp77]KEI03728.1 hypothetical protein Z953_04510 [Clostridium botulinum D str. 16868]KEI05056.1 hypothetical protein Z952_05845 [Clostridium botulinum C/D str. BKT75002]KEI11900.1 hypothetical protein Z954_07030 [Clostridium botulinum C/D str. BKT2873]
MKDVIFDDFQNAVDESLLRHRSLLDIITKLQETEGRINRAIAKSVTNCGCIEIDAAKQSIPEESNINIDNLKTHLNTHLNGKLCEGCRDVLEREIGNNLFYLTSLCNLLDLNLYDILLKEYNKINTLGKYNLR